MHPSMFATEWFMTMFCRGFSFDLVTRVFDVFIYEGIKIVYRVCLALLKSLETELLEAPFEEIMTILRNISSTVDAKRIMKIAWSIPLKRDVIAYYEAEFDTNRKQKLDSQRAAPASPDSQAQKHSPQPSASSPPMSPTSREPEPEQPISSPDSAPSS